MYKSKIIELLTSIDGTEDLLKFLDNSNFYNDPASAKYHSNFPGGLAEHSYKVYLVLKALCRLHKLNTSERTLIICAILHDLVKIDSYKIETRNHKNEKTNYKWESYMTYGYTNKPQLMPHGIESSMIASKFIKLTEEEYCAISYHMGLFSVADSERKCYDEAVKKYPLVLLLHHADAQAAFILEKVYPVDEIPFN